MLQHSHHCLETAKAVATEAGIYRTGDLAVTNDEFEAMTDEKVREILPKLTVISRCSPNTKLRLINIVKSKYNNSEYKNKHSSCRKYSCHCTINK